MRSSRNGYVDFDDSESRILMDCAHGGSAARSFFLALRIDALACGIHAYTADTGSIDGQPTASLH
jgi:hypothetical protein